MCCEWRVFVGILYPGGNDVKVLAQTRTKKGLDHHWQIRYFFVHHFEDVCVTV